MVQLNYSEIWTIVAGTPSLQKTCRGLAAVSRAFLRNSTFFVAMYYQGDASATALTNNIQQSTFYLLDLGTDGVYQVCGEWCKGTAYADWQRSGNTAKWMHLTSGDIHNDDGSFHFSLNFRARSFTTQVELASFSGFTLAGITVDPYTVLGNKAVNTVGIKDFGLGQRLRQAVAFNNELLIPGPRATSWTGIASNHGISLVPEMIPPVLAAAGAGLTPEATYEVVCVAEWTDPNGNRVRSVAGPPYQFLTGVGQRQVTYSGTYLHTDTGKENLTIALYRTVFINGIQSTQHYKVTDDLSPLLNDSGGASTLWTFVDTMTDEDASNNEILYTDKNFLDRYPCPAFRQGVADANRAYVVGYDGAVWFSGSKAEGDATWFSPAFRILLNNDIPKAVALLDTTLVIFAESSNIYVVSVNSLPANDGSGNIPVPIALPNSHGCTGALCVESAGIFFASTQGGIWLLTRGLQDVFIGKDIAEDIEEQGPVVDMVVDNAMRVHCLLSSGNFAVYDTISNCWSTYTLPDTVDCCGVNNGELVVASGEGATIISRQTANSYVDGEDDAIITNFKVQLQLGGIRNFKRIWNMQFEGKYRGAHELEVLGYFDNDETSVIETYEFTPRSTLPYIYELPPKVEECASVTLEFTDSFPDGPSAGFSLEMLSFELGIQQGLDRLSPTSRRKPAR